MNMRVFLWPLLLLLGGCSSISYYAQAVNGHLQLMRARQSVEQLLAAPDTDEELRAKLQLMTDARVFAVEQLKLPDNDSYSSYVETGRRYITWNVVAAPEFSLMPYTWCFPIAGCVSYRGYFKEQAAQDYADGMQERGYDVVVGGASAYSTLGWFDDPLVDTMMRGGDIRLVGLLFHELAHQVLYVKDDSAFNEAFATFVEQEGVRVWLRARGQENRITAYDAYLQRQIDFGELLKQTRVELNDLYADNLSETLKRERKASLIQTMKERYRDIRDQRWNGYNGYDGWFEQEINNARLVAVATYRRWVPAFNALFKQSEQDFEIFYKRATELSQLPTAQRREKLQALIER